MSEKKAETLFLKYKKKLIVKLKRKALNNTEINQFCQKELGSKYKGCYAQNQKFPLLNGYYILNNDIASGNGEHWVAIYLTAKTCYIYDSFSRDPKTLLKYFTKRLTSKNIKIISSDRSDKEQTIDQIICGHLSISWLLVCRDLGIKKAVLI